MKRTNFTSPSQICLEVWSGYIGDLILRRCLTCRRWHLLSSMGSRRWQWCLQYYWWLGYLRLLNRWNLAPMEGWREWCVGRWNPYPTGRGRWISMRRSTSLKIDGSAWLEGPGASKTWWLLSYRTNACCATLTCLSLSCLSSIMPIS